MDDETGLVRIGSNARRKPASPGIIDDQADDVGVLLVAQSPDVHEGAVAVDHVIEVDELLHDPCSS